MVNEKGEKDWPEAFVEKALAGGNSAPVIVLATEIIAKKVGAGEKIPLVLPRFLLR